MQQLTGAGGPCRGDGHVHPELRLRSDSVGGHGVGLGRWGSLCARQSHSTPFLVGSGLHKRFCCYKNTWRPAKGCALSLPRLQGWLWNPMRPV